MYGTNLQYITKEDADLHLDLIADHTNADIIASNLAGNLSEQYQKEGESDLFKSRAEIALVIFESRELYEECENLIKLFPFLKK